MQPPKPEDSGATPDYRLDISTLLHLDLPLECVPGIEASVELLRHHARKVEAFVYPANANKDGESES